MEAMLFQGLTKAERIERLDANAEEVLVKSYSRQFNETDRNMRSERNSRIDIELANLDDELAKFKKKIKAKRDPLMMEKLRILGELRANSEYVEGTVYKIVDQEEKMVGYYDEEGVCVEQRRMDNRDRQMKIKFAGKTGTED